MTDLARLIGTIQRDKAEQAVCPAPEYIGRPYRPGSGTEGAAFQEEWCGYCARDAAFRETDYEGDPALGCQILADTFAFDINDARYPKEWVYGRDGRPSCTAFTTDPKCPVRCDKTIDMFNNRPADHGKETR